jgi:hypothetical protein
METETRERQAGKFDMHRRGEARQAVEANEVRQARRGDAKLDSRLYNVR